MAKYKTPAMEKAAKIRAKYVGKGSFDSPGRQAWKRLKRNPTALVGMGIIIIALFVAIFANVLAPYDPNLPDYGALKKAPNAEHLFGTDSLGRDILSRCIFGARYSLALSLATTITSALTGGLLGTIAGYSGGKVDNGIMRVMDVFQAIPMVMMAMSVTAVLGNGIPQLIVAITISSLSICARTFRMAILTVRSGEYIESSRAINIGTFKMITKHLIPNAVGLLSIQMITILAASIGLISSLSYIGIGIAPPTPEWGSILNQGKDFLMTSPHMVIAPTCCILVTVLGFQLFGVGLRDALDPRMK